MMELGNLIIITIKTGMDGFRTCFYLEREKNTFNGIYYI